MKTAAHRRDKNFLLVLISLNLLLFLVTLLAFFVTKTTLNREKLKVFQQTAEIIEQRVEERMLAHVTTLRGLQAFWARHPDGITSEQFSSYVNSLNIISDYPAISSVAFFKRTDNKLITVYVEPLESREAALGFDHNTDLYRKTFLEQVRDSGEITSSNILTLMTTNRPGVFLTAPLYTGGVVPRSISERQSQLIGFVNLAFRDTDLFKAIFGRQNPLPDIDFVVYHGDYDSGHNTPEHVLFDSDPEFDPTAYSKLLQTKKYVTIGNTPWTIVVTAKPSFSLTGAEEKLPLITLIIGLTFSLAFALINLFFYRQHLKTWR